MFFSEGKGMSLLKGEDCFKGILWTQMVNLFFVVRVSGWIWDIDCEDVIENISILFLKCLHWETNNDEDEGIGVGEHQGVKEGAL